MCSSDLGKLRAGSVIRITMKIAIDGRLTVIAHEPKSGRELVLEAFVAGVVDSAETERLTRAVRLTAKSWPATDQSAQFPVHI